MDSTRPQPVIDAAKLGGLVSAAVIAVGGAIVLIVAGVTSETLGAVGIAVGAAVTAVTALIVYIVSLVNGRAAAAKVTPLEAPQDDRGVPLIPVDHAADYGEHAEQAGVDPLTPQEIADRIDPQE